MIICHCSCQQKAMNSASSYWEKTLKVKLNSKKAIHFPRECTDKSHVVEVNNNIRSCVNAQCKEDTEIEGVKIPNKYLSSCHHQMNNEYKEIYSEGSGLAPNQLLIVVTGPCKIPSNQSTPISGVIVHTHPINGSEMEELAALKIILIPFFSTDCCINQIILRCEEAF
ncbi:hypothetical protein Smp_171350 [Schistosoma mansoni]|uniref:hypothetical protein n=1 Tax=Schistosoma mansoni TaxID=6183 RepID=UPI00022C83A6|nr:hypothetical protein Smp_171350 [Schistosoma mansoni]|eukprot:XP_018646416.1 hypothetical protein Smp_171350 [Schistosoma mansoni]